MSYADTVKHTAYSDYQFRVKAIFFICKILKIKTGECVIRAYILHF